MGGFSGNIMELLGRMRKAKQALQAKQAELKKLRVEATSGGGMVKVVANGQEEILGITIDPEVVDPEDTKLLEDLLLAAIKEVQRKAKAQVKKKVGSLVDSLNFPDISKL